jgi:hypothetical protein
VHLYFVTCKCCHLCSVIDAVVIESSASIDFSVIRSEFVTLEKRCVI